MIKHVFLTGQPAVGKTTLVKHACSSLVVSGASVDGFYTEEVRVDGRRVGFDVVTLREERAPLSRIRDMAGPSQGRREYTVGQYVVDVPSFENLVLPLFEMMRSRHWTNKVFVIDEIGKMELFSQSFIKAVRLLLDSPCTILGTIPVLKHKPLPVVEEVRGRSDVKIFTVTKENRDHILHDIMTTVTECLKQ